MSKVRLSVIRVCREIQFVIARRPKADVAIQQNQELPLDCFVVSLLAMTKIGILRQTLILMFFTFLLFSCGPADKYKDQFWVISESSNIHERTDNASKVLKELKFGEEVYCRDKNPSYSVPKLWVEARSGDVRGFIERKGIAAEELYKAITETMDSAKDAPAQAGGLTGKKVPLRLKPEKGAFVITLLKTPTKADVLERVIVSTGEGEKAKRQVWYKVRLGNGRTGFIPANNMRLVPPAELNNYTEIRTVVSWYKLNEKEDPATQTKGSDYLVTYSSVGSDIGTDFTRIELYTYDLRSKQYATALAKSGLYGMLPVKIIDDGNDRKIIEIREHPKGDKNRIHVMQYSFPSPIKLIKEYQTSAEN